MTTTNPFAFDAEKMAAMFKAPGFDQFVEQANLPVEAFMTAQRKNIEALVEANKVAVTGYREVYERMAAIAEQSLSQAKTRVTEAQGQDLSPEAAAKNLEVMKSSFDRAVADMRELAEMTQKANTGAFDVIRARLEEAVTEFSTAAEKIAA